MGTFETVLLILLVADAIALAALILLQQGKGADIGAAFGSGGSNTVFGAAGGASFLMKLTVWLSIGFFVVTFGLAYAAKERADGLRGDGIPSMPLAPQDMAPEMLLDETDETDAPVLTEEQEPVDSDIPDV